MTKLIYLEINVQLFVILFWFRNEFEFMTIRYDEKSGAFDSFFF